MTDETGDDLRRFLDEQEGRRRERINHLEAKFKNDPGSLTDRDGLELIGLMVCNPEIESAQHFETLVTSLAFTTDTIDLENLKRAWKDFLTSETSRDSATSAEDGSLLSCPRFNRLEKIANWRNQEIKCEGLAEVEQ